MAHILTIPAVLFTAGCLCFAAFSWGVKSHFRFTGKVPAGMKLLSLLSLVGFVAFAAHLAYGHPARWWAFSLALFTVSLGLFAWAIDASRRSPPTLAFDTDKPSFLLRQGPYRYVRHPFYLSYILFWAGTAIAFAGLASWIVPVIMLALYRHAANREEQKFEQSELAGAYAAYRSRAGMFLPRFATG